jgi:aminocarboxymuconate-semialdehyde decarboxylase
LAQELNNDLEEYCATSPALEAFSGLKSLYGFGLLPLVPEIEVSTIIQTIEQLKNLPHIRGVIMGTKGIGKGLDDNALDPVWDAIQAAGLVVFIHPHYGVDSTLYGDNNNGHVLPLALGFPFETTIVSLQKRLIIERGLTLAFRPSRASFFQVFWIASQTSDCC